MPIKLNYTESGFGTPLILLHGHGEDNSYFQNQIPHFSYSYRVIAVDTRGHGKSPRGKAPFTLEQFADDLKAFLDSKNIKKASLLGFSDGGNIALIFTLKYPQYVSKLILNGANIYPSGTKTSFLISVNFSYFINKLMSKVSRKASRKCEFLRLMAKEPRIYPEELAHIKIPVLVIVGTNDLIKQKHTRLIAASIPNSKLCFLNGGHFIAKTNSVEFNKTVEKFLEE